VIEKLLDDVAGDVAKRLGQTVELPKNMPYINQYVTYLQRSCGLFLTIDKPTWKEIDTLRNVRNRYIHRISRALPEQVQVQLDRLIEFAETLEANPSNSFSKRSPRSETRPLCSLKVTGHS
jgi:hypothetical protein